MLLLLLICVSICYIMSTILSSFHFIMYLYFLFFFFFFNDTATTEIYTLSLHDALPISQPRTHFQDGGARWSFLSDCRSTKARSHLQAHGAVWSHYRLGHQRPNVSLLENALFELPVSYWTELNRWVNSPGYRVSSASNTSRLEGCTGRWPIDAVGSYLHTEFTNDSTLIHAVTLNTSGVIIRGCVRGE